MIALVPKTSSLAIAYVDPYSLEPLAFDLLKTLATRKIDMAVHFSVMDLHRNIEMEYDRARFDQAAPNWQEELPAGDHSKSEWAPRFFEYWRGLVAGLDFKFSKEMPLVYNKQGKPMYRMVFFARHDLPIRIWGDIARNPTMPLFV
jgi:three-Cys-motif partner protein